MPEQHATVIGGSNAERRIMCPGSAIAERDKPDTTSQAALDGTRKHGHMEAIMKAAMVLSEVPDEDREDIAEALDLFRDLLDRFEITPSHLEFEQRVKVASLDGVWGTADVVGCGTDKDGPLNFIVDWKFGHKKVEAEGNIQLGFYALAAIYSNPELFEGADRWLLAIVQPAHGLKYWYTDRAWLDYMLDLVEKAAEKIRLGVDERVAGSWCGYCKGAATCATLRGTASALVSAAPPINSITLAEGLDYIEHLESKVEALARAVRAAANEAALVGQPIPGWKLVEKIGNRDWSTNDKEVLDAIPEAAKVTVLSPTQVEKLLGKKVYAERAEKLVTRKVTGTTLVRASDRRPAITPKGSLSETLGLGPDDRIL